MAKDICWAGHNRNMQIDFLDRGNITAKLVDQEDLIRQDKPEWPKNMSRQNWQNKTTKDICICIGKDTTTRSGTFDPLETTKRPLIFRDIYWTYPQDHA